VPSWTRETIPNASQGSTHQRGESEATLLHHISIDSLRMAFFALKRDAASGVDGLTWPTYEADLDRNLTDLHERVYRGAYRALPSRRVYIPKPDGRQRPLAVAALEDKIVQGATAAVLNAIYECHTGEAFATSFGCENFFPSLPYGRVGAPPCRSRGNA
jgi:RNA-directed DNA polymerase